MGKIGELVVYYKKKGLTETLKRIKYSYFQINTFILYKRELHDNFSGITIEPPFRCVEGNLLQLEKERSVRKNLPREFYIDQTHGGKMFYLVYCEDELAYIHWLFRKGEYSRFFKIVEETTVEFNYIYTLPKFRGNRLQARTMNYICENLKCKGYKKAVGAVSADNVISTKGMNKTGLKEFKRVKTYFSFTIKTAV